MHRLCRDRALVDRPFRQQLSLWVHQNYARFPGPDTCPVMARTRDAVLPSDVTRGPHSPSTHAGYVGGFFSSPRLIKVLGWQSSLTVEAAGTQPTRGRHHGIGM